MFLRSLEDATGEELGDIHLECEVSKQSVSPLWRKEGEVINASEKYEILHVGKSLTLIVRKLIKDDGGEYSCDIGSSQTKAKVIVRGRFYILTAVRLQILSSFTHHVTVALFVNYYKCMEIL